MPPPEELTHMAGVLIDAAQRNVGPNAMRILVAAQQLSSARREVADRPARALHTATGFVDKLFPEPDGSEKKYVVFVPHNYTVNNTAPAILYLHGAGSRGSDGRNHLVGGLAKAIREKNEDFPFLVIFPQAREDEDWTPESTGGKRALAILKQVQSEYRVDPNRVVLTGVSMGGQGTWSLAAAEPDRWSAIVPICHGWKPNMTARLRDVPCWCFHGDADEIIPASQTRDMVRAIQEAGGKALYHEFIGVDHNQCADHVYALPDLYEWLLRQDRTKR
jgi:predicted peptidase